MTATSKFSRCQLMLVLFVGLIAGVCLPGLISHFARKEPVPNPGKAGASEMIITQDSLLPTMAWLARDRGWRTQADFEERFKGYEIKRLPEHGALRGAPPLNFEDERYVSVLLRKEDPIFKPNLDPTIDPEKFSDPNFRISRNADGSIRRNADGSIPLEVGVLDWEKVTWCPRRNADGSYSLKEDVSGPKPEIWYLLAAFNKSNDLCNWWCVFVSL